MKLFKRKNKTEEEIEDEVEQDMNVENQDDLEAENQGEVVNEEINEEEINNGEELEREQRDISALIKFDNVSKLYKGECPALEGVDLEIQKGEFVSIVGPSGVGKSTFLKLIYAEEMPTEGVVYFEGEPLDQVARRKIPTHRRKIGTVFQDFKLLPKRTAFENVAYALEVCSASEEEILEDVPQILEIVGLGDKMDKFPHELSGGEQQKIVLARALIHKPLLIIADEPTGNLDSKSSLEMIDMLLKINKLGTTVILASHDREIVDKAGKRVIVLSDGKVSCDDAKGKYKMC